MSLKKMLEILPILEFSSNTVVYALDETGISVELDNHLSWSPVGDPLFLKRMLDTKVLMKYSPFMNLQEQIWRYLKANLYKPSARESKYELFYDITLILNELNLDKEKIRSLADGRKYLL